jgi:flagellar protein FlbD
MILLRRLNGTELGVNADLIERVESTPDTVLTLVDGTKYVVSEPAEEVVARIIDFRARILAAAEEFATSDSPAEVAVPLRLVSDPDADPKSGSVSAESEGR